MTVTEHVDRLFEELKKEKLKPEYIVIGRDRCVRWMVEMSKAAGFTLDQGEKYDFKFRNVPVVVCESDILEVVPNAKHMLSGE